ncbi:MAG: polysaccharide biosynthesis/export family protein [Chthoniobacteraceae bacterium]
MKFIALGLAALLGAGPHLLAQAEDVAPKAQAVVPAPSAAPAATPPKNGVPLRNGDVVEVRIANVPVDDVGQISGVYTLDESGMINLPFIGLVKAGGLVPSQVETLIQNQYIGAGVYTDPTVTVNPPVGARFISVSGAVRAPQRVPYSSDLTLMSAIDAAGGPSDFAGDKIRLVHNGKIQYFSRRKLNKYPSMDPPVSPGDRIELVESWY